MAIAHDAYLFDAAGFLTSIRALAETVAHIESRSEAFNLMFEAGMQVYDSNEDVQHLALEYGGWDRTSLEKAAFDSTPQEPDDSDFNTYIVLIVYASLRSKPRDYGLGTAWRTLDRRLSRLGWPEHESRLLIRGRDFPQLVKASFDLQGSSLSENVQQMNWWAALRPESTAGVAGWLSREDIERLLAKLHEDEHHIQASPRHTDLLEQSQLKESYDAATFMLASARNAQCELFLVLSG
jgi:hypothetical protein